MLRLASVAVVCAMGVVACGGDDDAASTSTEASNVPSAATTEVVETTEATDVVETTKPAGLQLDITEDLDVTSTMTMDVYAPIGGGPWPVVVMWHGVDVNVNASNGHRRDMADLAPVVAEHGAVVFNVSYSAVAPLDAMNDTGCSLQLAVETAAGVGGDPERVIAVGNSFGGAVALIWGLDSPFRNERFTDCVADADSVQVLPDAVVAVASGIDPRNLAAASWRQSDDAVLDAGTPMLLVGGNPGLQVYFATQRAHPAGVARPEDSIALHEALLAAGYESTLVELAGAHGTATRAGSPEFPRLVNLVVAAVEATDK